MAKPATQELELIQYYREKRPPTLKQYLHRRFVKQVMEQVKGETGIKRDTDSGKKAPASAFRAKELMKGISAESLIAEHTDWVKDYEREYGDGSGNKEA